MLGATRSGGRGWKLVGSAIHPRRAYSSCAAPTSFVTRSKPSVVGIRPGVFMTATVHSSSAASASKLGVRRSGGIAALS